MSDQRQAQIYDFDIIVIGGGPAGMSAALRARWLRTYFSIPASVAVIDPLGLGGLSNWKTVLLTGPSWGYTEEELTDLFKKDFSLYPVEVIEAEVTGLDLKAELKTVKTETGQYKAPSLIIATGLLRVTNERAFLTRGLIPTLKDHGFMADLLEEVCAKFEGRRVFFVGTHPVVRLWDYFQGLNQGRLEARLVIEPPIPEGFEAPPEAVVGRLRRLEGRDHLEAVVLSLRAQETTWPTDLLVLDFESYMQVTNSTSFGQLSLATRDGFLEVDRELMTNQPGVFAAGDCTGPPFGVAKAIGEGVTAGFNAYRYTYRRKFGVEPPLYAFYPSRAERMAPEQTGFNISPLRDDYRLKLLYPLSPQDKESQIKGAILPLLDGRHTVEEIRGELSRAWPAAEVADQLRRMYEDLLLTKRLTIHV